ncbi:MAG: SGNH/GDSL hydrolase family protein [Bdellovibrionales bacterium]|nr:SGNH/GDSL hydrolase family protein [Bdellovibrionales bacterium]
MALGSTSRRLWLSLLLLVTLMTAPLSVSAQSNDGESANDDPSSGDTAEDDAADEEMQQPDESTQDDQAQNGSGETVLPTPLLRDVNGDGTVNIDAFGDSITRGVGDFIPSGAEVEGVETPRGEAGYPLRVELLLGVSVANLGLPGERLTNNGLRRFASNHSVRNPDFVVISGGTNDAIDQTLSSDYFRSVQTMLNIAHASGSVPILATVPRTCCSSSGLNTFIDQYNEALHTLAVVNDVALADISKAYDNTCNGSNRCFLLNRPEGVHPNESGYDVSGEVVIATLLGIDIFAPEGPTLVEQALGLEPGAVKTIPDPVSMAPAQ